MTTSTIFDNILVSTGSHPRALKHYHVVCPDNGQQLDFVETLKKHCEEDYSNYYVADGNCLWIDQSPKDLFRVIFQALDPTSSKTFKSSSDFLTSFDDWVNKPNNFSRRVILCLRRAEVLQDIDGSPVIMDMFRGFGSPEFKNRVILVTLSTIVWPLMLSNSSVSISCINLTYKPYGNDGSSVNAVMRIQARKRQCNDENVKSPKIFCTKFANQCCTSFENKTSDPNKLYSLICQVAAACKDLTDPAEKGYKYDVVKQAIQRMDDDRCYFNVSQLIGKKKTKEEKTKDALDAVPYYAKYVLIAAFCCSFNRKSTDLRFFDREREGRRRTAGGIASDANKFHENGPQTFSLTRLLGIVAFFYHTFLDSNTTEIPDVLYLLNKLCEMQYITRISNISNLSKVKFRCDATSDFVRDVAASVKIDIADYLDGDSSELTNKLQLIQLK